MHSPLKLAAILASLLLCGFALAQSTRQIASLKGDAKSPSSVAADASAVAVSEKPATAGEYVIGESDTIRVNVWHEPDVSQTVMVRPDGYISLPLVNEIHVAGYTTTALQNVLAERFSAFLTNAQVTVTVVEIRSKRAYITGEIVRPGGFAIVAPTTVLQLVAQAGGFTPYAKRSHIYVLRQQGDKIERFKFNYPEVVQGRNSKQNIVLRSGDTVVVP
jgi:polysaccharide export outer membrane protein